jgi:hypothetical protein
MMAASLFCRLDSIGLEPGVTFGHCPQVFDSVWLITTGRIPRTHFHPKLINPTY